MTKNTRLPTRAQLQFRVPERGSLGTRLVPCLAVYDWTRAEEVVHVYGICIRTYLPVISGDIRYDNRNYATIVQRKSRVRGQISASSVPSCVCANDLYFRWSRVHKAIETAVTAAVVM